MGQGAVGQGAVGQGARDETAARGKCQQEGAGLELAGGAHGQLERVLSFFPLPHFPSPHHFSGHFSATSNSPGATLWPGAGAGSSSRQPETPTAVKGVPWASLFKWVNLP